MNRNKVSLVILAVSVLLILTGVSLGQYADVMTKAIHICLECIGIG